MPRATCRMRNLEANCVQIAANQAVASVAAASFKFVVVFVCSANDVKGNQKLYTHTHTHRGTYIQGHTHTQRHAQNWNATSECESNLNINALFKPRSQQQCVCVCEQECVCVCVWYVWVCQVGVAAGRGMCLAYKSRLFATTTHKIILFISGPFCKAAKKMLLATWPHLLEALRLKWVAPLGCHCSKKGRERQAGRQAATLCRKSINLNAKPKVYLSLEDRVESSALPRG